MILFSHFSTNIGRARAWLRTALMQKKLADYFRNLLENRELRHVSLDRCLVSLMGSFQYTAININFFSFQVLKDFYEPKALLRSDESSVLVIGLMTRSGH